MDLSKISIGNQAPKDVNVIIEVPMGSDPVKYEFDKESSAIFVDRIIGTPMFYPANYGFVPHTLSEDGDPIDLLVVGRYPLVPGSVINARPVGVLVMEDEKGMDEKVLAVPSAKIDPYYDGINDISDLPDLLIQQIGHFFENYKDLEKGKWVKIKGWEGAQTAARLIQEAIDRAS